jgi:hypothetical protein
VVSGVRQISIHDFHVTITFLTQFFAFTMIIFTDKETTLAESRSVRLDGHELVNFSCERLFRNVTPGRRLAINYFRELTFNAKANELSTSTSRTVPRKLELRKGD